MKVKKQEFKWETPPVRITHIPTKITGEYFAEGLKRIAGNKKYLPREVKTILSKAGLSSALLYKSKNLAISKKKFIQAVEALAEAGYIDKNRSRSKALAIYNEAAKLQSWKKTVARNIERRREDYRLEARELIDSAERERERARGDAEGPDDAYSVSLSPTVRGSADRLLKRRDIESIKDKRAFLEKLRSSFNKKEEPGKSGWSHNSSSGGWSGSNDGWRAGK